ncbi:MAG: S41 family peptidase [Candidatus Nanopelagicales bacterium]|nr:S41 family peptidase [Candidatus Nanopelagicales bacterium]
MNPSTRAVVAAITAFALSSAAFAASLGGRDPDRATLGKAVASATIASKLAAGSRATRYTPPVPEDFSNLSWTEAFRRLNRKLAREYAFTKWKGINFTALYRKYHPLIARAEATNNRNGYYLTLRRYIHRLRDGHVRITEYPRVQQKLVGGGFGVVVMRLDNGRVVVTRVLNGSPAARAGIKRGARILKWRGRPIDEALAHTSTTLGPSQPTTARKRYEQLRYLVRAPIGDRVRVTFQNRGRATRIAALRAVDDHMKTLRLTNADDYVSKYGYPKRMVEHRIIGGNVGYVRVIAEVDLPATLPGDHTPTLRQFRNAIREFIRAKVAGIIIDVRSNSGGSDQMVADFMASFYKHQAFYEYQNYIVPASGRFQIWIADDVTGRYSHPGQGIHIKPLRQRFNGPVVALVDNGCISSGEGVAMGIKRLPNGKVVGTYGTNGSFGMVGDGALMPGQFVVDWPFGQSLDKQKIVQVDSRHGTGGVMPDVRVPLTLKNALRSAAGRDVVLGHGLRTLRRMVRNR